MMRNLIICILAISICAVQAFGFDVTIDGVLDEPVYGMVTPLKSDISSLYLVPMTDGLYIGAEVEDANINVATPEEFWNASCIEIWLDWGNEDSLTFDRNDQQFWFCPVMGNGDQGYAGQWHRAADNIPATINDYANQDDKISMAFVVNKGDGYVIEARIAKEAMEGYEPNGVIGFNYSADVGGAKHEWEDAMLGGSFFENPSLWPDLEIAEVMAVESRGKLPVLWSGVKTAFPR